MDYSDFTDEKEENTSARESVMHCVAWHKHSYKHSQVSTQVQTKYYCLSDSGSYSFPGKQKALERNLF